MLENQFPLLDAFVVPLRLSVAVALAACLGLERETRRKPAGLRTFALVSLGAAGFVIAVLQGAAALPMPRETVEYDPTGLIGAVAGGIGFLGAGAIINDRTGTRGITTAAGIWICGAIGVACGVGQYVLAVTLTTLALAVLVGLRVLEDTALHSGHDDPRGGRGS